MAVSQDGFIAGPNGETPWSDAEFDAFNEFIATCDVVLMGRKTFECMRDSGSLAAGPQYIVVTNDESLETDGLYATAIHAKQDMPEADKMAIIGGGELNGQLAKLGLIDEIYLDIEPVELQSGIPLFGRHDVPLKLELVGSRQIGEATVQRHYKVIHD
jgi:dihydrofolate reductase